MSPNIQRRGVDKEAGYKQVQLIKSLLAKPILRVCQILEDLLTLSAGC